MEVREGGDVEVASDEDGFRGAWFSAKVVKKEKGHVVVEYRELRSDKDESKALREKVALRHLRPPPPSLSPPPLHYALYQEVDAYDNDGWWVGVVTKLLANSTYLVYFMQTNEEIQFHHAQLRPHFDFLDNKWFQPSEALASSHSLEDEDPENDNGTIMPYIFCQTTGTRELSFQKVEDNSSEPLRRSLRHTLIKRTGGTEGHLDNISPSSMKKARKDMVDQETTELSSQQNGNWECHQFSALPSFDKGADITSSHCHREAINHQKSFERGKTKSLSGPRKTERKISSHLNDVSTCERKDEDTDGTGATDIENLGKIGGKKSCFKTSPSEEINAKALKVHNEANPNLNGVNVEPHNVSHNNISACSLKTRKPNQKNMLNETYTLMLDKDIEMENTNSCTPSGSLGEGEKTFTVTIPHLEYVGYCKADQGNSGGLHGRASLRKLKLLAYHSVLQALYLQGAHNWKHELLLTNLREALSISNEEHSTELRRLTTANYD